MVEMAIEIDEEDYGRIQTRGSAKGFETPEAYAAFILETVIDELEGGQENDVEDRLEDLGYLE